MLNFWSFFFLIINFILIFMLFIFKSPLKSLFISELNWIILIVNSINLSSINNDPRFFLITFVFLFLAALEIILYLMNFNYKKYV